MVVGGEYTGLLPQWQYLIDTKNLDHKACEQIQLELFCKCNKYLMAEKLEMIKKLEICHFINILYLFKYLSICLYIEWVPL